MSARPFKTVERLKVSLRAGGYLASDGLSVSLFLALAKARPLFLEGEAGVGKTEVAKVLATLLGRDFIRLQCYEGLDISQANYEWSYAQQLVEIQAIQAMLLYVDHFLPIHSLESIEDVFQGMESFANCRSVELVKWAKLARENANILRPNAGYAQIKEASL